MARNLELKVRCTADDHARVISTARSAGGSPLVQLTQRDTYFAVPYGRLKVRQVSAHGETAAELIRYSRPDFDGMRLSTYRRTELAAETAADVIDSLAEALGVLTIVEKVRCLVVLGSTRVHLDDVQSLGSFIELETVLGDDADCVERGQREYDDVVELLGLAGLESVPGSYSDLLREREAAE